MPTQLIPGTNHSLSIDITSRQVRLPWRALPGLDRIQINILPAIQGDSSLFWLRQDIRMTFPDTLSNAEVADYLVASITPFNGWPVGIEYVDPTQAEDPILQGFYLIQGVIRSVRGQLANGINLRVAAMPNSITPLSRVGVSTNLTATSIYAITNPGRVDSDGVTQATPLGDPSLNLVSYAAITSTRDLPIRIIRHAVTDALLNSDGSIALASQEVVNGILSHGLIDASIVGVQAVLQQQTYLVDSLVRIGAERSEIRLTRSI